MSPTYVLELYYFNECPYCVKVLHKIKELGLKEIAYRNTRTEPSNRDQLIADTGRSTVPCLYINGKPMHESDDIVDWLEKHKEKLN